MSDAIREKLGEMSGSELIEFIHTNTCFSGLDDIFDELNGETLFDLIDEHTRCASTIEEALEEEFGADAYASEFEDKWREYIDAFEQMNKELKHISAFLWLTDCDTQEELWAEWFRDKGYNVCDTFLCTDWLLADESKYCVEIEEIISAVMQVSPYDNHGKKDCFWRNDCVDCEDITDLIYTFKKLDKMLDIFLQP